LGVGWLIQWQLTRTAELTKVPIEAVAKLFDQFHASITAALHESMTATPERERVVEQLRVASNELSWLGTVIDGLEVDRDRYDELCQAYWEFKKELTDDTPGYGTRAATMARQLRLSGLRIQSVLCKHILDKPERLTVLTNSGAVWAPKRPITIRPSR